MQFLRRYPWTNDLVWNRRKSGFYRISFINIKHLNISRDCSDNSVKDRVLIFFNAPLVNFEENCLLKHFLSVIASK